MASSVDKSLPSTLVTAAGGIPAPSTFPTTPSSLASPTSATAPADANTPELLKPSFAAQALARSPKLQFSPRVSPGPALTGAAALADERRTRREPPSTGQSLNPATAVVRDLLGSQGGMSTPKDAPTATTTMNSAVAEAANAMVLNQDTSSGPPTSQSQGLSNGGFGRKATTATANPGSSMSSYDPTQTPDSFNRAFSLPSGPINTGDSFSTPTRSGSLPNSGWNSMDASRASGGRGEHKCAYCELRFTRPHNLKSHLLTHSQEKPFSCNKCPLKFRRQHDLKRHVKLHTGERPHVCDKCGRTFARGDALNRHMRAQGGCAGRRISMDGLGPDEDFRRGSMATTGGQDDSMDGVLFADRQNDVDRMDMDAESELGVDRRASMPTMRAPPAIPAEQMRQPSTYPPVSTDTGHSSRLYPPVRGGSTATPSDHTSGSLRTGPTSVSSGGASNVSTSIFSTHAMTESPGPLSPSIAGHHNPEAAAAAAAAAGGSIGNQLKSPRPGPQGFGRRATQSVDLPPITTTSAVPSLPPLNESYPSTSLPPPPRPTASQPTESANMFASMEGMFQYMQSHMRQLEEKVNRLQDEVVSLRSQLASQGSSIASSVTAPAPAR